MIFWILFSFLILILTFLLDKKYYFIIWFLFALISGLRYYVGPDFTTYKEIFDLISHNESIYITNNNEFGYIGIIKLCNFFGLNNQAVIFIMSVMTIFFLKQGFDYYLKDKEKYYYIVLIGLFIPLFYIASLNIIRQTLAASILFYASKYIIEKKDSKYILFIIIASLFHMSSLLFFIFYFLFKLNIPEYIYVLISSFFVIVNPFTMIYPLISNFPYAFYLVDPNYSNPLSGSNLLFAILAILLGFIIVIILGNNNKELFLKKIISISIIMQSLAIHIYILNRLQTFFKPFIIISITILVCNYLLSKLKQKSLVYVSSIVIIFFTTLFLFYIKSNKYPSYNQYAINFSFIGEEYPLQIVGDYKNVHK